MRRPILRDSSGQLTVILPLIMAITVASALLWGYMHLQQSREASNLARSDADQVTRTVLSRMRQLIAFPNHDYGLACDTGGMNGILDSVRDFANNMTAPPAWPLTYQYVYATGSSPNGLSGPMRNCVLMDSDVSGLNGPVQQLTVTIDALGPPNFQNMSRDLTISVSTISRRSGANGATTMQGVAQAAKTISVSSNFRLQVASLISYGLVLTDPTIGFGVAAGQSQVEALNNSSLQVMSPVFWAGYDGNQGYVPSLSGIVSQPWPSGVVFNDRFDFRSMSVMGPGGGAFDSSQVSQVWRNGYNLNVFGYAQVSTLPIEDPAGSIDSFTLDLDYGEVDPVNGARWVLPGIIGQGGVPGSGVGNQLPPPIVPGSTYPPITYTPPYVVEALTQNDTLLTYNPGNASFTAVPGPPGIPTLASTCAPNAPGMPGPGNDPQPPSLVHMRWNEAPGKLTINYAPTDPALCALIMVPQVTVNVPAGVTAYFFGQIITQQLIVQGGGTLYLIDPASNVTLPSADQVLQTLFPAANPPQTQAGVFSQFRQLAATSARNFFVPIMTFYTGSTSQAPFAPYGAVVMTSPCVPSCSTLPSPYNSPPNSNPGCMNAQCPQPPNQLPNDDTTICPPANVSGYTVLPSNVITLGYVCRDPLPGDPQYTSTNGTFHLLNTVSPPDKTFNQAAFTPYFAFFMTPLN